MLKGASFLAHQGRERLEVLQSTLAAIAENQPTWRVGASVFLPRYSPATSQRYANALDDVALYVIADPETRKMHAPYASRGRGRTQQEYLAEENFRVTKARFVQAVLDAQVANGRDVLISPWMVHGVTGSSRELDLTIDFATRADRAPQVRDRTLLFGVEATDQIFADNDARADMLDRLVELPERPFYMRMMVGGQPNRLGFANGAALGGLREVVQSLADNDRAAFLPQAGLAGWLMLPFGARAFGAGISSSLQRCTTPEPGGGGGGQPPLPWYFAPNVLGFVLASELDALRDVEGWEECDCPFCEDSPPDARNFNAEAAGQHFLWWCAALANEAHAARSAIASVRNRLRDASQFWRAAQADGVTLDDRSQPKHLAVWTQAVR